MSRVKVMVLLTVAVFTCSLQVFADKWALPTPKKYYSENKQYYVEVIPRQLESQLKYFEDKVAKKEPAGSKKDVKNNYCKAILYKQNEDGQYEKVWESRLSNDVAPASALISNSGEYVITFDNWHSVGYGDDVVVIYDMIGKMIKRMGLSDFVPPNTRLPQTQSSIWWGGKHYIDEKNLQLVLKVVSKSSGALSDDAEYKDVRVDLRTGEVIKASVAAE